MLLRHHGPDCEGARTGANQGGGQRTLCETSRPNHSRPRKRAIHAHSSDRGGQEHEEACDEPIATVMGSRPVCIAGDVSA
jgi:hypothetical protein